MDKVLILLSLTSFATSQSNFNISAYDSQLRDIFDGLIETEKKIGNFLSNLSNFVGNVAENSKSNKSRHCLDLNHLLLDLQLQGSIGNFESYQQLTGCENVASKISEIDVDLKKFGDFMDRLELNMTELYHRNLYVTYDFILYRKLQTSQQDILDIILGVNEATVQYLNYILQLQVNIQYEKSIATNLKLFMTNFCECDENVYGVSHNTNSNVTLSDMESALTARQARIINAASTTLSQAQKLLSSKNVSKELKIVCSKLTTFCQKMIRIDDYSAVAIPFTNTCSDLSKVQNFMTYRRFHYTQVLSFVMTNSSVLGFYKNMVNSWIANATIDQTLSSSILTAVIDLETELKNYTDDLELQLSYLTLFASLMRKNSMVLRLFCSCRVAKSINMTSSSTKGTTTRKVVFSTASFMSTTETTVKTLTIAKKTTTKATRSTSSSSTAKSTTSSSTASTRTRKPRPTVSKITTMPPFSNPVCSFTKILTDYNGTYIKTACLMETASNATYANLSCQTSSMQLMTVDSNMTQTALTIFVQETLSEGTFWISGVNGTEMCKLVTVNETGLKFGQDYCAWGSYYSICEYLDSKVPKKVGYPTNLDACGLVFPIMIDIADDYTRYACVMSYTRSYLDSNYYCMINGMDMLKIEPPKIMATLNEFLVSLFGNSSGVLMWVNASTQVGSCAFLDGSKVPFAVDGGNCDQLQWSVCEAPYDESY